MLVSFANCEKARNCACRLHFMRNLCAAVFFRVVLRIYSLSYSLGESFATLVLINLGRIMSKRGRRHELTLHRLPKSA